jgi:outer membrane protein OmpA-like peptidoglycan-associated protein
MNMIGKLAMNKLLLIDAFPTKKVSVLICGAMLLSACASNGIVKLESSVKQLNDLNDLDRDGVVEARENCANTVLGATIDNYGCGAQTTIVEPFKVDIKFANNSYDIPPSALPKIQQLASFLEENKTLQVQIEGHTSKVGSAELNQILSIMRAKAVESVLVNDLNITNERVMSQGYGFERLADLADTETAHANNRRIMAELSKTVHVDDMIWTIYTVDQAK